MAKKAEVIDRGIDLRDKLGAKANDSRYGQYAPALGIHSVMIGSAVEDFAYRAAHGNDSPHYDAALRELDQALSSEAATDPNNSGSIDRLLAENVEARFALKAVTRSN